MGIKIRLRQNAHRYTANGRREKQPGRRCSYFRRIVDMKMAYARGNIYARMDKLASINAIPMATP